MNQIDEEQAARLAKELSELSKDQFEALQAAMYTGLSKEEGAAYDKRADRISKICSLLANFRPL
ncbi:MAG: hypothetical protein WA252_13980 [Candidatus Sulfotelmatobacter sp.]|jgi:hypothetical protein